MPLVSSSGKAEAKSLWQPRPVRASFQNKTRHCPHFTDEIALLVTALGPSWLDPSILTVSLLHMITLGVAPTVHWRKDASSNPQYRNQTSSVQTAQLYTQLVPLGTNHFHCQSSLSQGCCLKCSWGCFSSSPAVLCDGGKTTGLCSAMGIFTTWASRGQHSSPTLKGCRLKPCQSAKLRVCKLLSEDITKRLFLGHGLILELVSNMNCFFTTGCSDHFYTNDCLPRCEHFADSPWHPESFNPVNYLNSQHCLEREYINTQKYLSVVLDNFYFQNPQPNQK